MLKLIDSNYKRVLFALAAFVLVSAFIAVSAGVAGSVPKPPLRPASNVSKNVTTVVPLPPQKPYFVTERVFPGFETFEGSPKVRPWISDYSRPMGDGNTALYRDIFKLQAAGDMRAANQKIKKLTDYRLRGHVLYQRYMHPTAYISNFEELRNWMTLYADHPGADKIYKLLWRKQPDDFRGDVKKPVKASAVRRYADPTAVLGKRYRSSQKRSKSQKNQIKRFENKIRSLVNRTRPTQALKTLQTSQVAGRLDSVEYDRLIAKVATGYLHAGKPAKAYELAILGADRSGKKAPHAGWVAGLVAWKEGDYARAATYFELPGNSEYASGWLASAGAYWTARSLKQLGDRRAAKQWLVRAAEYPRTFYGLLAMRALGNRVDFAWDMPEFHGTYEVSVLSTSAGQRAAALMQAGQVHLAEAELMRLDLNSERVRQAVFSYAMRSGLPALSLLLGMNVSDESGRYYDAALYPVGQWNMKHRDDVDPALIHAIMRQESRFDAMAESASGALGLMQILPSTASYVSGNRAIKSEQGRNVLFNPQTNIEIGQKYLSRLLRNPAVDGDILSLLIAYNAGPGNLAKWQRMWAEVDDPLLFIEVIPSRETRAYVERVLAGYWIYRMRDGQSTPTLEALVKGKAAKYASYNAPVRTALNTRKISKENQDNGLIRLVYNN